jgi:hypothetical protein
MIMCSGPQLSRKDSCETVVGGGVQSKGGSSPTEGVSPVVCGCETLYAEPFSCKSKTPVYM